MRRLLPTLIAGLLLGALLPAAASAANATIKPTTSLQWTPADVSINTNETVTWDFTGTTAAHNIVILAEGADFPATAPANAAFTYLGGEPKTFPQTFPSAGTFRYLCAFHYSGANPMRGTITVTPGTPPLPPPPDSAPLPAEPVAFASDRVTPGANDLFVVKGDLGQIVPLTSTLTAVEAAPAYSPDNTRIAFESNRDATSAGNTDIFVMDSAGNGETNLTPGTQARNAGPAWSPDGKKIAFSSDRTDNVDIYVMNPDGTGLRRITDNAAEERSPTWSPDGKRIAFTSDHDGRPEAWAVDVDPAGTGLGTNPTKLVTAEVGLEKPAFSPDGTKMAYSTFRGGTVKDLDVCVTTLATKGQDCLTGNLAPDLDPAWSPDGTEIIFTRDET